MADGPTTPPLSPDHALDWPGRTATAEAVLAAVERRVQRRREWRRRAVIATTSLALVLLAGFTWLHTDSAASSPALTASASSSAPSVVRILAAAASSPALTASATLMQPARQLLADGSQIELNGDAQVHVEFSSAVRRVTILRGEAHFKIAHETTRPFVVVAGEVSVRAVGTAFAVRLVRSKVDVFVTDGRVAVDRATLDPVRIPTPPLAFVAKGAAVAITPADLLPEAPALVVVEVPEPEQTERLAWRVPRLEFNDTPLREVVILFNRHGNVHLRLASPTLGELRVSGFVRADNTSALLQLLRADYGVEAQRLSEHAFVLNRPRFVRADFHKGFFGPVRGDTR